MKFSRANDTYEAVALGSAGELIGDDDGLQDLTVLVEVLSQGLLGSLPRESSNEDFGQRCVPELSVNVVAHCHWEQKHPNNACEVFMKN